jgi:hypothetical protein
MIAFLSIARKSLGQQYAGPWAQKAVSEGLLVCMVYLQASSADPESALAMCGRLGVGWDLSGRVILQEASYSRIAVLDAGTMGV